MFSAVAQLTRRAGPHSLSIITTRLQIRAFPLLNLPRLHGGWPSASIIRNSLMHGAKILRAVDLPIPHAGTPWPNITLNSSG